MPDNVKLSPSGKDLGILVPDTRTLTAGDGLTGGGDLSADRTFNVGANADGSIVVNPDDVQVGVLATDAQHGNRGGGALHATAVPSGAAGFMTGADKAKLDGMAPGRLGYVYGGCPSWNSITTVAIGVAGEPNSCRDQGDSFDIEWTGALSADITVSGAGGLQSGSSEAENAWYQICVIADTTAVNSPAALLIPAGTAFSQSGYDVYRRLGWVRNRAHDFMKFACTGKGNRRRYFYDVSKYWTRVLSSGNATVWTAQTLTAVVPPTSTEVMFVSQVILAAAGNKASFRMYGSSVSEGDAIYRHVPGVMTNACYSQWSMPCSDDQQIEWIVSSSSDDLWLQIAGFVDEI